MGIFALPLRAGTVTLLLVRRDRPRTRLQPHAERDAGIAHDGTDAIESAGPRRFAHGLHVGTGLRVSLRLGSFSSQLEPNADKQVIQVPHGRLLVYIVV